jgi:hypothetical protein
MVPATDGGESDLSATVRECQQAGMQVVATLPLPVDLLGGRLAVSEFNFVGE